MEIVPYVGGRWGYSSVAEFVRDAIRRRVDELRADPAVSVDTGVKKEVPGQAQVQT